MLRRIYAALLALIFTCATFAQIPGGFPSRPKFLQVIINSLSGLAFSASGPDNAAVGAFNDNAGSPTSGIYVQFNNAGVLRGAIGTGGVVGAGCALGDFCFGAETGNGRLVSGSATALQWFQDGAVATSGLTDEGFGSVNVAQLYRNNVQAIANNTFIITYVGFTAGTTGTASYALSGNNVCLTLPALVGTSNANTFTATGLPAAIQPANDDQWVALAFQMVDNGGRIANPMVQVTHASGTLTFADNGSNTGWTASGTKGSNAAITFCYNLN